MARTPRNDDPAEAGAVESLEQAFHLLRNLSAAEWLPAAVGPLTFLLLALWAGSDLTRAGVEPEAASLWSGVLVGAFAWLTIWQAVFARRIWMALQGDDGAVPPWKACLRPAGALLGLTGLAPWLLSGSVVLAVTLGWTIAFFRHATVLAFTRPWPDRKVGRRLLAEAFTLSHTGLLDYHLSLLLLGLIGLAVWVNVAIVLGLLPTLVHWFSGVENGFTLRPAAAFLNWTFVFTTLGVTWAMLNPILMALFVLRVFRHFSRTDGADLLVRLRPLRQSVAPLPAALAAMLFLRWAAAAEAQPPPPVAPVATNPAGASRDAGELRDSIRQTLSQPDYRWRNPVAPGKATVKKNAFAEFIESTAKAIGDFLREVDSTVRGWIRKLKGAGPSMPTGGSAGSLSNASALSGLVYVLLAVAVGLLIWLLVRFIRGREPRPVAAPDPAGAAGTPDLNSEATLASQLPEDQWLALARQQLAAGEYRLAIRALFLASLARLGEQQLIEIARSKSNRDYQHELGYRARSQHDMQSAFAEAIGIFEYTWYGWHEAGPPQVERLEHTHARLKKPAMPPQPSLHAPA